MGNLKSKPEECNKIILNFVRKEIKIDIGTKFKHYLTDTQEALVKELPKYTNYKSLEIQNYGAGFVRQFGSITSNINIEELILKFDRISMEELDQITNSLNHALRIDTLIIKITPSHYIYHMDLWIINFCNLILVLHRLSQNDYIKNIEVCVRTWNNCFLDILKNLTDISEYTHLLQHENLQSSGFIMRINPNVPDGLVIFSRN